MNTNAFLAILRGHPHKPVIFSDTVGHTVPPEYHVTEIKATSIQSMDCGGKPDRWNETVVQLWHPFPWAPAEGEFMPAEKFLNIYDRVARALPIDETAEVRFEYGGGNFFASSYHVASVAVEEAAVRVRLEAPGVTCKARDRERAAAESRCLTSVVDGESEVCCAVPGCCG